MRKTCLRADGRVKLLCRVFGASILLGCAAALAQDAGQKIDRVEIKFVGPASVSEEFVRANIRLKAGDVYRPILTQDDVHSLYSTGQFYNIRITTDQAPDGNVVVTYIVQVRPRITEIKIVGNKRVTENKLRKKVTVKVGDAEDEQKLFTDSQEMEKLYQKYGYPDSTVKYHVDLDELTGHAIVTFDVVETAKVKIRDVQFEGATAFTQKTLRSQLKTRRHNMFSWLLGTGVLNSEDFEHDRDTLTEYYRDHGYLDFEIKDVKMLHPTENSLIIKFVVFEGRQYKVGNVKITGNKLFSLADIRRGIAINNVFERSKDKAGPNGLPMDTGDVFTPDGFNKDREKIEDFYGSKGYIEVAQGNSLRSLQTPNVQAGTMDVEFQIEEGEKSRVEKIDIRGNIKTRDKVIRRELAISPGETLDMVRVKISKQRLEGTRFFSKVDIQPEPTDPPITGRQNLVVNVEEQDTGQLSFGAGFTSDDSVEAFIMMTQGNFDLFNPPYFTGGGQKLQIRVAVGLERQDYTLEYVEPWFLNHKLTLDTQLFWHQLDFESPNNVFDETRIGTRVGLSRALWTEDFVGSFNYTVEQVDVDLNNGWHGGYQTFPNSLSSTFPEGFPNEKDGAPGSTSTAGYVPPNVPNAILDQVGDQLFQREGISLAYTTENSVELPNHGQRTELSAQVSEGSENSFYKLDLRNDWFFPGFFSGHVIEFSTDVRTAASLGGGDVPFYDRFYLGGLYSLRGFKYRNVAPRQAIDFQNPSIVNEPIGGDSSYFESVEYSIPIIEKPNSFGLRIAVFYDIGAVMVQSYTYNGDYSDDYGIGLRLNIPHLGPLRLDYGIPLRHDINNGSSGQFQFGIGFTRPF